MDTALRAPIVEHRTPLARIVWEQRVERRALAANLDPPVSPGAITRWCSGEWPIPPARIPQLAALLGVAEGDINPSYAAGVPDVEVSE